MLYCSSFLENNNQTSESNGSDFRFWILSFLYHTIVNMNTWPHKYACLHYVVHTKYTYKERKQKGGLKDYYHCKIKNSLFLEKITNKSYINYYENISYVQINSDLILTFHVAWFLKLKIIARSKPSHVKSSLLWLEQFSGILGPFPRSHVMC